MRTQSYILIAVAIVSICVAIITTMTLPTSQPTLIDTKSVEGVFTFRSYQGRLTEPSFYVYEFGDTRLLIRADQPQPNWVIGEAYRVTYIERNWMATDIEWHELQ